jgi:hypothetical protein
MVEEGSAGVGGNTAQTADTDAIVSSSDPAMQHCDGPAVVSKIAQHFELALNICTNCSSSIPVETRWVDEMFEGEGGCKRRPAEVQDAC